MAEYEIEDNIERPSCDSGARKYPFNKMAVGQSFEVSKENHRLVANASWHFGRDHKMKFSIRKHNGAYRCWRVA